MISQGLNNVENEMIVFNRNYDHYVFIKAKTLPEKIIKVFVNNMYYYSFYLNLYNRIKIYFFANHDTYQKIFMKIKLVLFLIVIAFNASSQTIFKKISFSDAVAQSQQTGKLVLVQLESFDCEMCNYVVTKAFENEVLAKKIKETFIAIKVDSKHADRNLINGLYDLQDKSFGTLFIDGNKNLVHRFDKTTTFAKDYEKEFDVALYQNSEVIKLNFFGDNYKKSKNNDDLELWIQARGNLNLNNDSLLNIYSKNLISDSINSLRVLSFIAKQSPIRGSISDNILRRNSRFNVVWYAIPLQERIYLNHKIISKSMQKAISEKNESYGLNVANFARAVYSDNKNAANNVFNFQAMKYYEGVVDMDKYIMYATFFHDSVILKTTAADVLRSDSIKKAEMMSNAQEVSSESVGNKTVVRKSFSFRPEGQNYTNTLNEAAWFVYKNTNQKIYLQKALEWASKGNQYSEKFEAIDTEARLLYKLGEKHAAIELMEKAVQLKNEKIKAATAFKSLDIVLNNMKENKAVIDAE